MIDQMKKYIKNLNLLKTPVAIVGMGKSGNAARLLLNSCGISIKDVVSFDSKLETADFNDPILMMKEVKPQTLVVSPGIPLSTPWIQEAQQNGIDITSEISLSCAFLTTEKIIGVTGSVGKSTTVSLLEAGLKSFSNNYFVGGNLGTPLAEYTADLIRGQRIPADWIVLELSSYQLENCEGLSLEISAITYLTANHLERYDSIQHYYDTKWYIINLTKNKLLLNCEGGDLVAYSRTKGSSNKIDFISKKDPALSELHLEKAMLIGQHNQDNLALASAIAIEAEWPAVCFDEMKNFKGLAHRLENLGIWSGIRFINDSKATAIDSVLIAVNAAYDTLSVGGSLFLLLGGRDKNLPWEQLNILKSFKDIEFVFFGECRTIAQAKAQLFGSNHVKLGEAMVDIFNRVKKGDTVLLSPGGTSLDEFKSFEDRGNFYKNQIQDYLIRSSKI